VDPEITKLEEGKWLIRVERQYGDVVFSGEVVVLQDTQPSGTDFPHLHFAGARAWQGLSQAQFEVDDMMGAIECAQKGIEQLGEPYKSPDLVVKDDTTLHFDLVDDLVLEGRLEHAAESLIQVLVTRLRYYLASHSDSLEDPK
jgi:hypothetical protein